MRRLAGSETRFAPSPATSEGGGGPGLRTADRPGSTRRDHAEVEQLDIVAAVVWLALFIAAEVGREVFLVVIAEHGGDTGVRALFVGDLERAEQVRAGADAYGDTELAG